ncbi:hypothetical protein HZB04_01090 [Candidatus Wolfebacteria bacterium]|nr:hypothetical protein [Candidatus Wolfebacteria bacterium]
MALTLSELKKVSAGPAGGSMGTEPEKDRTNLKIAVLAFFGSGFAAFCGYFLNLFLNQKDFILFSRTLSFSSELAIAALFIFWAIFLIQTVFIESFRKISIVVFLEFLAVLAVFSFDKIKILSLPDWRFLAGAGIAFLFLILAAKKGKDGMRDAIKIRFWRLGKIILPTAIAAAFLFISVAYVFGADKKEFAVPYSDFKALFSSSAFLMDKVYPEFNISWTVNEFVSYLAQKQIEGSSQFGVLPKSIQKQMVDAAAKEFTKRISDFTGAPLNAKLSITEAAYEILKYKISNFPQNTQVLISVSIAVLLFFILESIALPVRWVVAILAFIIYEVLLAADFAKISYEGISKETIVLK